MYAYPKTSATIIQAAVASSRFTQSTSSARESHPGPLRRKRAKWCLKHDMSLERLSTQEVAFGGIPRDGNSSELKQMPLDSHTGLDRLAASIRSIELSRPPASRSVQNASRIHDVRVCSAVWRYNAHFCSFSGTRHSGAARPQARQLLPLGSRVHRLRLFNFN